MAEGFELVRTVRQHLRRSAALFEEGKLDDALAEANSALALDPQNLPAQALRDRIDRAIRTPVSLGNHVPVAAAPTSYVPHGVNAASWRGFEQRIQERRFKALLDTINTSIVAGDAITARAALEEAHELRPDAPELAGFEARVAAVPVSAPAPEATPAAHIWMRAMGAAALLLIGVSMLMGLEWIRPSEVITSVPASIPAAPVAEPQQDLRAAEFPEAEPVPIGIDGEDDSVPAIVTPEEPTLRPRATTGTTPPPVVTPVAAPVADRPVAMREPPIQMEQRPVPDEPPIRSMGETSDDFVERAANTQPVDTRPTVTAAIEPEPPPRSPARLPSTTSAATSTEAPAAAVMSAAVVMPREESQVEEVLRRYARAYDSLDASAARAVWPSVNEKQLAKAFQDLSSQNVSFENCEIDIRGAVANASCRGQASYVVKVGDRAPRTEPRTWRFELRRDGEAWKIESAETRRLSTSTEYR